MKALSIRQPWAELIAQGRKTLELRSWDTPHRGPLLICASNVWHASGERLHGRLGTLGVAVCLVDLLDCRPVTPDDSKGACVDVTRVPGYSIAWVLARPVRVEAVPVKGQLRLFTPQGLPPHFEAWLARRIQTPRTGGHPFEP